MQSSPSSHSKTLTTIIRASEISQFVFCQRAWWLGSVQGYQPVNDAAISAGTRAHHQHGRSIAAAQRWQQLGYFLFAIALLLGAVVLWRVLGGGQ
jgi:CRISPR/Cas system-associated exonuclease Cas4 (RecB family)